MINKYFIVFSYMNIQSEQLNDSDQQIYTYKQEALDQTKRDIIILLIGITTPILVYIILYLINPFDSFLSKIVENQYNVQNREYETKLQCQQVNNLNNRIYAAVLVSQKLNFAANYTQQIRKYYQAFYKMRLYEEHEFCVIVPTYNNAQNKRYLNNIQSISSQKYQNMSIIVIDDASTDNTYQLIQQYVDTLGTQIRNKITLKKNFQNKKSLYNIYWAAHNFCSINSIITIVDGDDFLINSYVLKLFNAVYHREDVWMVYSNFLMNINDIGYSHKIPQQILNSNMLRKFPGFSISHQHTFKCQLFRQIKQESLKDEQGNFLSVAYDLAIYFPMAEMAGSRMKFIEQPTYYYTTKTGLNDFQINSKKQTQYDSMIRKMQPYKLKQQFS